MLACQGISVTYPGGRVALRGASCTLERGAITAVVGPNGAGKSTLLRVLAGVLRPDAGSVTLNGRMLADLASSARARHVALVAQQPSVAFDFDARRVVAFGADGAGRGPGAVDRAIERFALTDLGAVPFGALSVGQRQRVSLARAWAQLDGADDGCLLADEPVSAMDPAFVVLALGALRSLADRGCAVGIVLHDLSAAARVADRAVLIDPDGRTIAEGAADAVLTGPALSGLFGTPVVRTTVPGVGVVIATGAAAAPV